MTRVYVGNLPFQSTEEDVRATFARFGEVSSVQLMTDQSTGRSRGFGFVNMRRFDDADEAIARLNGSQLQGRRLVVNEARSRAASPQRMPENRWHLV